jgi:hypothetical protein
MALFLENRQCYGRKKNACLASCKLKFKIKSNVGMNYLKQSARGTGRLPHIVKKQKPESISRAFDSIKPN